MSRHHNSRGHRQLCLVLLYCLFVYTHHMLRLASKCYFSFLLSLCARKCVCGGFLSQYSDIRLSWVQVLSQPRCSFSECDFCLQIETLLPAQLHSSVLILYHSSLSPSPSSSLLLFLSFQVSLSLALSVCVILFSVPPSLSLSDSLSHWSSNL